MLAESFVLFVHHPNNQVEQFTEDEVGKFLKKMKVRKAPGYDGIQAEHIKYGGQSCLLALTKIYNSITYTEHVPMQFKIGIMLPIPKGDKDKYIQDNNRGITLLSSIAKLYESAYVGRLRKWVRENKLIDDLQGAAQEKCSSLHSNWLVRETISHFRERGSSVYVALLDVAKAFDSVWHNGLFHVMYKMGIDRKFWRILMNSFQGFKCCVSIGDTLSDFFETTIGLHQGAPFSMLGYCLIDEMLLKPLIQSVYSIHIGRMCVTAPAYADDLTLNAISVKALQKLLDVVYEFSCKWRLQFNPQKCKILVYGDDKTPNTTIRLGREEIKRCDAHTHVGTLMTPHAQQMTKHMKSKIAKCKKIAYTIPAIGSKRAPVTPKSGSYIYKSVCLSKLLYGTELLEVSSTTLTEMESFHASVAKVLQGLPKQTCNIGALRTMGWISIQGKIDFNKLIFLWRLICLPMSCIYKRLLIHRYTFIMYDECEKHQGPLWNFLETAQKYGVLNTVKNAIETGNFVSLSAWKREVKDLILCREERKWTIDSNLFSSLHHLSVSTSKLCLNSWWLFAQNNPMFTMKCKTIMRLLMEVHILNSRQSKYNKKQNERHSALCICDQYEVESVEHMLFKCTSKTSIRELLWESVLEECPSNIFKDQLTAMAPREKTSFILGGLNDGYVVEWDSLYCSIANFTHGVYTERLKQTVM